MEKGRTRFRLLSGEAVALQIDDGRYTLGREDLLIEEQ
jgi:hypothetical protein